VAQCVWWLASVIGLEQRLVSHIGQLQKCEVAETSERHCEILHSDRAQRIELEKAVSPTARDLQEDPWLGAEENWVHPERRNQLENINLDIRNLDLNDTNKDSQSQVIESTKAFLAKSQKERKALNKQKRDRLSRMCSGKIRAKPQTAGQRKYLHCIPKDTIEDYLENRK
jgi:hypothetical protein